MKGSFTNIIKVLNLPIL